MNSVAAIAFTEQGCKTAAKLVEQGIASSFSAPERFAGTFGAQPYGSLHAFTRGAFEQADGIVFVGATGIAVRAIAPFVADKFRDPAVVCVDELGNVAVPLLSGHVGGANELAHQVAAALDGIAAVSTATDLHGVFAVDVWARDNDLAILERALAKEVSAALLSGETVGFASDFPLADGVPAGLTAAEEGALGICVTLDADKQPFARTLHLVPRIATVGVGTHRDCDSAALRDAVDAALAQAHISPRAVRTLASIDVKADEPAVLQLAQQQGWPLAFYSAEQLQEVEGEFTSSEFVQKIVGVGNVCERAAVRGGNTLVLPKQAGNGTTVAIAVAPFSLTNSTKWDGATVAPKLYVVGLGPGAGRDMTVRAREALEASDLIVGYTTYIKLVEDEFSHKELRSTGMRKEIERCRLALEEAAKGRVVSMVCSGDSGVYGMAGPCLELAPEFPQVEIEVIPGISAAMGGASVLGAPLTHDFALISLSDLLTPWETIATRLDAAARADFGICLYNPQSHKRADYLQRACDILLRHRSPENVCGTVRNIGREGQEARVLTLGELRDTPVDMFTTVFIGNSKTQVIDGRMVTPRGYDLGKGTARVQPLSNPAEAPAPCSSEAARELGGCAASDNARSRFASAAEQPQKDSQTAEHEPNNSSVLVFGGTVEGRTIVEWLAEQDVCDVVACSATEYGGSLLPDHPHVISLVERLDAQQMEELMRSRDFACVVDATHPYATVVSQNVAAAAQAAGLPLLRIVREQAEEGGADAWLEVPTVQDAAEAAAATQGNILLTTGSKDLAIFVQAIPDFAERVYVRILPVPESLDYARELGIPTAHTIAMQGPFTQEMNEALIHSLNIAAMVTKSSGPTGGFPEKAAAAKACGVKLIVVHRPEEGGVSLAEAQAEIVRLLGEK